MTSLTDLIPPLDLLVQNRIGIVDHRSSADEFRRVGEGIIGNMISQGFIRPDSKVLDVGCGLGRLARPLTKYLNGGEYCGVDIVKSSIEWCRANYASYQNFDFRYADVYNTVYNPAACTLA